MIDVLIRDYGYPILNLARWGDTLADIVVAGEYLPHIGTGRADTLLFSAGGNDILGGGELWRFLKLFDVDHATAADAPYYILPEFYQNLDDICEVYKGVIENIRMTPSLSGTMVVGHGYDYVIPRQSGPWLGEPMMRQGLHPYFHAKLCRAIVKIMMDALNAKLSVFQTIFPSNFTYVNLRGTLTAESEWFDELHAKSNGAKKFAAKMNAALVKLKAAKDTLAPIPVPRRANRIAA
jgi:lysophospholipase L1-like esterase